jgi:hypothetical protein
MSGPLAIAAVSAVLKNMLDNALVDNSLSSGINAPVTVKLIAPNRIKTDNGEATQINLYLSRSRRIPAGATPVCRRETATATA